MQHEGALLKSKGRGQMPEDTNRQQWLAFVEKQARGQGVENRPQPAGRRMDGTQVNADGKGRECTTAGLQLRAPARQAALPGAGHAGRAGA